MGDIFSDRISDVPRSFIREILKFTLDKSVISFAGGLPNRDLFPVQEIRKATDRLLEEVGKDVLQYSSSEGYLGLREWIADRYRSRNVFVHPDNILITTGSQQGMDLIGKTLLNDNDDIIIEEPGYLGAIQSFSIYRSSFHPVPVSEDGIDLDAFHDAVTGHAVKLFYCVPNFQNPSGISYSEQNRRTIVSLLNDRKTVILEDDPYGELRFLGREKPSFHQLMPEQTILLGSFSKIVAPSFRIGWVVASEKIMEKLVIAKQASDLHTNYFCQRIIHRYLQDNDIDEHIMKIRRAYGRQRDAMVTAIQEYFPAEVLSTHPEGGMFLWITLPKGLSAMHVFQTAIEQKVAFVPGDPFYVNKKNVNTLRLNYSSVDEETIRTGIRRLGNVLNSLIINN